MQEHMFTMENENNKNAVCYPILQWNISLRFLSIFDSHVTEKLTILPIIVAENNGIFQETQDLQDLLHQKKAKNLLFNRRASWNALLSGTSCPCSLTWSWLSSPSNERRRSTFLWCPSLMTLILYLFGVFVKKTSKISPLFPTLPCRKWINIRKISPSETVLNASFHKAILLPHRISEKKPYKLGKEILCEFENSDFHGISNFNHIYFS